MRNWIVKVFTLKLSFTKISILQLDGDTYFILAINQTNFMN